MLLHRLQKGLLARHQATTLLLGLLSLHLFHFLLEFFLLVQVWVKLLHWLLLLLNVRQFHLVVATVTRLTTHVRLDQQSS